MQRSHSHTFHVTKVHRICHSLVIHSLHGLVHRIHAILRVITLSLALHAVRCVWCSRSRTGSHHTVNRAW